MKSYVFDASALFAFLQGRPGAARVNEILKEARRGRAKVLMSAVNYGEVYGRILRDHGPDTALSAIYAVSPLPIELLATSPQAACRAADVKAKYKLYYVDSFAAALTLESTATLVTSDSDFRKLGHAFPILWLKS
jgi:predicted nucleic acid-binding protein